MAPINRTDFVAECMIQGDTFSAWPYYLVAIALLRSKIDDAKQGDLFGPYLLSQAQWDANRADPEVDYEAADISAWRKQCLLFAAWTRKVQEDLIRSAGQSPDSEDIYLAQFPGASIEGLAAAFTATAPLMPAGTQVASTDQSHTE